MPTISIFHHDFERLLGRAVSLERMEALLPLVKGELKDHAGTSGEIRIELQDSNRPDLWCVEGITRQIRCALSGNPIAYPFFSSKIKSSRRLRVLPDVEQVRPFVAACVAVGYKVTKEGLDQFIQTQEKLAGLYGRKRQTVSVGLYRLPSITFPVTYGLVNPQEARFVPLGLTEKMTLDEILAVHPKGQEYGSILAGHDRMPLLWDKEGVVLSFPPIINSRGVGEVCVGDKDLLIEVTGTDLSMVILTLNIFAANLADRGASIEPIEVTYPYATQYGKTVRAPVDISQSQRISIQNVERALGVSLGSETIQRALRAYGYQVKTTRQTLSVKIPPYRNDLMHVADVAEDVAISQGYDSFTPVMPSQFTVGALSPKEQTTDHIRDLMVGFGFQEVFSNILASRNELVDRMRLENSEYGLVVEIANPMSQQFACLRPSILPCLLRMEAASIHAFYPHRLFEVGEIALPDLSVDLGSRTLTTLAAIVAHPTANFSEIHAHLDLLMYYLARAYTLEPATHPSFLDGRVGKILCAGRAVGFVGELHPELLDRWQVTMPIGAFELQVED